MLISFIMASQDAALGGESNLEHERKKGGVLKWFGKSILSQDASNDPPHGLI